MALILFRVCPESVIDSRFFFQRNSRFFRTKLFACTLISCCSIINDLCELLTRGRVLRDPFIISHPFRFVKGFLKSFFNFFAVLSNRAVDSSRRSARLLYHIFLILSRGFLKVFSTFFVILRRRSSSQKCPTIKSHRLSFVKRFCKSFSNFFRDAFGFSRRHSLGLFRLARCQLAYYSTISFFCQGVFSNFFTFGSFGILS